jgi:hypothetical protein
MIDTTSSPTRACNGTDRYAKVVLQSAAPSAKARAVSFQYCGNKAPDVLLELESYSASSARWNK